MIVIKVAKKFSTLLTIVNTLYSPIEDKLRIIEKNVSLRTLQYMKIGENKYNLKPYCIGEMVH